VFVVIKWQHLSFKVEMFCFSHEFVTFILHKCCMDFTLFLSVKSSILKIAREYRDWLFIIEYYIINRGRNTCSKMTKCTYLCFFFLAKSGVAEHNVRGNSKYWLINFSSTLFSKWIEYFETDVHKFLNLTIFEWESW
jgi:hypothetical protein